MFRALAKDPKRVLLRWQHLRGAREASQHTLAPTAQLASNQPSPSPAAATGYETVAVAPSYPVLPTETTPTAHCLWGSRPTAYPVPAHTDLRHTRREQLLRRRSRSTHCTYGRCYVTPSGTNHAGITESQAPTENQCSDTDWSGGVIIAGGALGSVSLLVHFGMLGVRSGATTPWCGRHMDGRFPP